MADVRLSSDIGGTFTDIVLELPSRRLTHKTLTTSESPESGLLEGVTAVLSQAGLALSDVDVFIHGTTLATNAILERRGARTALVATEGFRDILVIGTESRYDQYDLYLEKPTPLVPRALRFTIRERMDAQGRIYIPLDEAGIRALTGELRRNDVQSVAIAFLHSYRNAAHEHRTAEILREELPGVTVTLSAEVCPEVREYERTSTAVVNAYIQPLMAGYLGRMSTTLASRGFRGSLYLVTSGGGLTSLETARKYPVRLVESGPAGGAFFAAHLAARSGEPKVLSFDMGGTTAKICFIRSAEPTMSRSFEVDRMARFLKGSGLPLRIPIIEMVEIGAGGGSIASVDRMKRVVVGPKSAGSVPGPACYGKGGVNPTVTDADVALGLIDPHRFAGGSFDLQSDLAENALTKAIGSELSMSTAMAAYAVYETVCENMANAARAHAAELGAALPEHTLIAFGGAAPLHAARVAEKVGIRRVVVPVNAGVGSAVGFLTAPVSYEVVRSRPTRIDATLDSEGIARMLDEMADEAHQIVRGAARAQPLVERRLAFMRYVGQGHEIGVELSASTLTDDAVALMREVYESEYATQFSRTIPNADIEVMTWAVQVSTVRQPLQEAPSSVTAEPAQPAHHRPVMRTADEDRLAAGVFRRDRLKAGSTFSGPCLIVEDETTTFVPENFDGRVDAFGSIVMTRRG